MAAAAAGAAGWRRKRHRDGDDFIGGAEGAPGGDTRPKPSGKKAKRAGSPEPTEDPQGHFGGKPGDLVDKRCEPETPRLELRCLPVRFDAAHRSAAQQAPSELGGPRGAAGARLRAARARRRGWAWPPRAPPAPWALARGNRCARQSVLGHLPSVAFRAAPPSAGAAGAARGARLAPRRAPIVPPPPAAGPVLRGVAAALPPKAPLALPPTLAHHLLPAPHPCPPLPPQTRLSPKPGRARLAGSCCARTRSTAVGWSRSRPCAVFRNTWRLRNWKLRSCAT